MSDNYAEHLSDSQLIALAIIPKITGTLSWIGSFSIIYNCVTSFSPMANINSISSNQSSRLRRSKTNTYKRLLCLLSFGDILSSTGNIMSTWAIPKDTTMDYVKFNIGNTLSCNIQGFFIQFGGVLALMNNCLLCIYYLLRIRYKWSVERIATGAEPVFHFTGFTMALIFSVIPFFGQMYNPTSGFCWVAAYPADCMFDENINCIRGENAPKIRSATSIIVIVAFFVIIGSFGLLYRTVKALESRAGSTRVDDQQAVHKKIYRQAWHYIIPFFIVYAPSVAAIFVYTHVKIPQVTIFMRIISVIFTPIQVS